MTGGINLVQQIESSDRIPKLSLPPTAMFLGLSANLIILLNCLIICLGIVGQPPDAPGILPSVLALTTAGIAILVIFILFIMIAFLAKMNLWHSAALGWVLTEYSEDPQIESVMKRIAVLPFRKARIGFPLAVLSFVIAIASVIFVRVHFIDQPISTLDGLNVVGVVCSIIVIGLEFMNFRNEKMYNGMTYEDLRVQVEQKASKQVVPEDITEHLPDEDKSSAQIWFFIVGILLAIPWSIAVILLMQL